MVRFLIPFVCVLPLSSSIAQLIEIEYRGTLFSVQNDTTLTTDGSDSLGTLVTTKATINLGDLVLTEDNLDVNMATRTYSGATIETRIGNYGFLEHETEVNFGIFPGGSTFGIRTANPAGTQAKALGSLFDGTNEIQFSSDPDFRFGVAGLSFELFDYTGEFDKMDELVNLVFGNPNVLQSDSTYHANSGFVIDRQFPELYAHSSFGSFREGYTLSVTSTPVPEPSTYGLIGVIFVGLLAASRICSHNNKKN